MKYVFLILFLFSSSVFAQPPYQNPSPQAVYSYMNDGGDSLEGVSSGVQTMLTVFVAQVLKTHPEYAKTFIQDLPSFSKIKKSIFLNALVTAGIQDPIVQNQKISPPISLDSLDHMQFSSGLEFDLMVVSFLATGDEIFLTQPMAFLNEDPEILFLAYEFHNRLAVTRALNLIQGKETQPDFSDFFPKIEKWPQKRKERFSLTLAAWTCLDVIKSKDPTAAEKIATLCKKNPRLDYLGTVNKILKG